MPKPYYQTTKVVKVTEKDKVVVRATDKKVVTVTNENKIVVKSPGLAGPKGDPGTQILTGPGLPSNLIGKVGDLYVDTNTKIVYGPKTVSGWDTTKSLFDGFNRDLLGQVFNIPSPSEAWEIHHGLGYNPNATCIDSAGNVIEGDISYPNENTILIEFIGGSSGKAYLS